VPNSLTITSPASPDRVFDYLAQPRNLLTAKHEGSVVSQSVDPADGAGSWTVLAFDQLRVRIEYTTFDRPRRIGAVIVSSGAGPFDRRDVVDYALAALPNGGTEIVVAVEANSGVPSIVWRLSAPLSRRGLRRRFAAIVE
jgi:hypothetical protein